MEYKPFFIFFLILTLFAKFGFVFVITNKECVFRERGAIIKSSDFNAKIDFYVPFNWKKWNENNELIISSNHLSFVVRHPSKLSASNVKTNDQVIFLPLERLRIGWNTVWLIQSPHNLIIKDVDENIWFQKSTDTLHPLRSWHVRGMFAFVNCSDTGYRYYKTHGNNYNIPLITMKKLGKITVTSNKPHYFDISISRRKYSLCTISYNDTTVITADDELIQCHKIDRFEKRKDYTVLIDFTLQQDYEKNHLTIDGLTFTDILIHVFYNRTITVQTEFQVANVFYLDYFNDSSAWVAFFKGQTFGIIIFCLIGILFFTSIFFIVAFIIVKRKEKIKKECSKCKSNDSGMKAPTPEYEPYGIYDNEFHLQNNSDIISRKKAPELEYEPYGVYDNESHLQDNSNICASRDKVTNLEFEPYEVFDRELNLQDR